MYVHRVRILFWDCFALCALIQKIRIKCRNTECIETKRVFFIFVLKFKNLFQRLSMSWIATVQLCFCCPLNCIVVGVAGSTKCLCHQHRAHRRQANHLYEAVLIRSPSVRGVVCIFFVRTRLRLDAIQLFSLSKLNFREFTALPNHIGHKYLVPILSTTFN